MNTDEIKGKLQDAFGKTENAVGKVIGSQNLQNAGAEDQIKGSAKETWGNAKDAVSEAHTTATSNATTTRDSAAYNAGKAEGHVESGTASLRDKIVSGAEHFKENFNEKVDNFDANERAKRD